MLEGLHPNRPTHVLQLMTDERSARTMTDLLGEMFDPTETAVAAFEAEDGVTWRLEAYFADAPDEDFIRDLIRPVVGAQADAAEFRTIDQKDWVRASLEGLVPVRAGRFRIHGSHDRDTVRPNELAIEIEAALAFGTGHHGTTRGCLAALNEIGRRRRPRRILDVGTGTGVLAIAAARRFRRRVAAGDIDAIAVEAARDNARKNRAHPYVRPVRAAGLGHPALRAGGPYDLVLANILARPLRALAPSIRARVAPGGEIVLSGLLGPDVPGVVSAYRAQGLILVRRRMLEGWATLLFRCPLSSA